MFNFGMKVLKFQHAQRSLNWRCYRSIVLFKMFLRWFFANNKTKITSTALKLCSPMEDVMS